MRGEIGIRFCNIFTALLARKLWVGKDLSVRRIAIWPAVISAVFERVKRFVRFLESKMIRALARSPEEIADPFQPDGISQTSGKFTLLRAVRIHFDNACPHLFFFYARVAGRSDRDVKFAGGRERNGARQVPAAVFIAQAVVWKSRDRLWILVGRRCFTACKFSPRELVGLGKIEPVLSIPVTIKLNAVRILKICHVRNDLREFTGLSIPAIENINHSAFVIRQVIHIGNEDSPVRSLSKKADAFQPFSSWNDLELSRKIQIERLAVS